MRVTRDLRDISEIIVHCSATDNPDQDSIVDIIDLHTSSTSKQIQWGEYLLYGRGWLHVGYHYYIDKRGNISIGIPLDVVGSHCLGRNTHSIGVCLGGNKHFTLVQKLKLMELIDKLQFVLRVNDKPLDVYPHGKFNNTKTCPNFDLSEIGY